MSFPVWNSDPSFNKITSSYFKDLIDLSGNFIIRNGTIRSPNNTIEFDDTLSVINIPNTLKATQLKTSYDNIEYTVGLELSNLKPIVNATALKCSNITYDASLNKTTVSNLLEFTGTLNAFSLADFNNSITNSLSLTSPAQSQLTTLSTDLSTANTNIGTLTTKLTDVSFATANTTIGNTLNLTNLLFTGNINSFTKIQFDNAINRTNSLSVNCQDTLTDLQSQISAIDAVSLSANQTFTGLNKFSNNFEIQNQLIVKPSGTTVSLTQDNLGRIQYLSSVSSNVQTAINTLNTKLTRLTYTAGTLTTTITNNTSLATVDFTGNINTFTKTQFDNAINRTNSLTVNCQDTLTSLQSQITGISAVSLGANNVFTGANTFNSATFNGGVLINSGFGALYNSAVQFVFYPSQTTFTNGSAGENVFEFTANNTDRGITFQGGKGSDGRSLFGLYYLSGSFANPVNRLPILYGRDTGTQSTNVLTVASGTLATTNLTFSGTLNTISTTIFGYLSGLTENIKTSLDSLSSRASTLETKNTGISYSGTTTTIANTLASSTLTFSGTLNTISTTVFGYLSGLTENIKTSLDNLSARILTFEIVGTIIMSPLDDLQTTTSNKYLTCNGQAVSRTTYSALFTKFGELFGVGNGSTTFNLPNYNGMFLRGMGNQIINSVNYGNYNSTYAPDQDSIQNHTHSGQAGSYLGTVNIQVSPSYRTGTGDSPNAYAFTNTGQMATGRINDFETKPVSIGIYYYVRT
jgi:microcystin-dependent protein